MQADSHLALQCSIYFFHWLLYRIRNASNIADAEKEAYNTSFLRLASPFAQTEKNSDFFCGAHRERPEMCCGNSPPTPFRISRRLFFRKFRHFIPFSKASGDRAAEGLRATEHQTRKESEKVLCGLLPISLSLHFRKNRTLSLNYSHRIVGL
ncbi:hypothetical protein CEXT_225751 [Caerostris extrusa]|uniref:Uncharacterized protein n=1 Tax=Caerostris extrusa TaxID=172846 RepID=A0AAV4YBY2_CAEEX|nr:hypothetical protein CEXT_225751 [Caerostris extrusa]